MMNIKFCFSTIFIKCTNMKNYSLIGFKIGVTNIHVKNFSNFSNLKRRICVVRSSSKGIVLLLENSTIQILVDFFFFKKLKMSHFRHFS